jgi:signal transduction histidine kinase
MHSGGTGAEGSIRIAVGGDTGAAAATARDLAAAEPRIDAGVLAPSEAADAAADRVVDAVVLHDEGAVVERLGEFRNADPDVPVFVVTDDAAVAAAAVDAGATDYLLGAVEEGSAVLATRVVSAVVRRETLGSDATHFAQFDRDLQRLLSIASARETPFAEKVEEALALGCDRLGLDIGFVSAIDRDFEVVSARGSHPLIQSGSRDRLSRTYCRKTVETDEPLAVENAPDEGWADDPAFERYGLSCYLGATVVVEGEQFGTLCFADTETRACFTDADVTLVELLAQWVGYELERKDHVEELRAQNDRFEELARTLSHDLGNLLEVFRSHLEFAIETGDLDRLERAKATHDRATELLEHMVTLARAGRRMENPRRVDLGAAARDAWEHVGHTDHDLTVSVEDGTAVRADRGRLLQLFENLLDNAVEHGSTSSRDTDGHDDAVEHGSTSSRDTDGHDDAVEHGSTSSRDADTDPVGVEVGTFDGGFYVEDDGEGIPEAERGTLFDGSVGHGGEGTGLGLNIVEQVARAHGWSVRAADGDRDGAGARFEVTDVPELRSTARDDRNR